jgi:hypothetical protein
MDSARTALIRHTKQRIAISKTVIATVERKGGDASEYRRQLDADERFLASGCAPPQTSAAHTRSDGTAVGYIMPPGAK